MAEVKRKQGLKLFIDWHSYGQYIMYRKASPPPLLHCTTNTQTAYGFTCDKTISANHHVKVVARDAANAMKAVHGTVYKTGTACELLYPTSGSSEDYAYDVVGADYAYTIELRPGDNNRNGFHLPEDQIQATGEEAFAGVRQMLRSISAGPKGGRR